MTENNFSATVRGWLSKLPIDDILNPPPVVSVLRLTGVIGNMGPMSRGLTLAGLEKSIEKAFSASRVKTVALVINSPGGSPVQSAMIARRIRQLADEKEIPVVAFAEDVAASGGYWLACAADEIFADANSIIGSIGVVSAGFGFVDALERIGVERRVHTSGRRKAMLDPFQAESPEDIARLNSIQADVHESFRNMVLERRGEKLNAPASQLFEGDIWTGAQAESLGLIDGISDMRTVMRDLFGVRVKFKEITSRGGLRRWLPGGRDSAAREHVQAAISVLEEWAVWKRFGG
jgi:serine protease SohB